MSSAGNDNDDSATISTPEYMKLWDDMMRRSASTEPVPVTITPTQGLTLANSQGRAAANGKTLKCWSKDGVAWGTLTDHKPSSREKTEHWANNGNLTLDNNTGYVCASRGCGAGRSIKKEKEWIAHKSKFPDHVAKVTTSSAQAEEERLTCVTCQKKGAVFRFSTTDDSTWETKA